MVKIRMTGKGRKGWPDEPFERKNENSRDIVDSLMKGEQNVANLTGKELYRAIGSGVKTFVKDGKTLRAIDPRVSTPSTYGHEFRSRAKILELILSEIPRKIEKVVGDSAEDKVRVFPESRNISHTVGLLISRSGNGMTPWTLKQLEKMGKVSSIPGFIKTPRCSAQKAKLYVRGNYTEEYIRNHLIEWPHTLKNSNKTCTKSKPYIPGTYLELPTLVPNDVVIAYNTPGTGAWYAENHGLCFYDGSSAIARCYRNHVKQNRDVHKAMRVTASKSGRVHITPVVYRGDAPVRVYSDRELYAAMYNLREQFAQ